MITETLEHLMDDMEIAAVKIGMLGSAEAAKCVAAFLKRYYLRHVVLDPIIRASSGAELITRDGLQVMKDRILGRVAVITPNVDEAAALTGLTVTNMDEMQLAAQRLHEMGVHNVLSPADILIRRTIWSAERTAALPFLRELKFPANPRTERDALFQRRWHAPWRKGMICLQQPRPPSIMWKSLCARRCR